MAIFHLSAKVIQRSKGHSAVAAAAYRAGERLRDARQGVTHDYLKKQGVVWSAILAGENAPEWVFNRGQLWNAVEAAERQYNGQPAREICLALPHELMDEQNIELLCGYVQDMFVSRGMVADVSIHAPDQGENIHAHVLLTMKELDGDTFATRKNREWNRPEQLEEWREAWAERQNHALEKYGHAARVDHRTLEAQGIDREPTRHIGKEATAMERRGERTDIGDKNRKIIEDNHKLEERLKGQAAIDAEIKRQFSPPTRSQPEKPNGKGLRYAEWYAMQPEPSDIPSFPTAQPEAQPVVYFENNEVHNTFGSKAVMQWKEEIRETGEIAEIGGGGNWYDRTASLFDLIHRKAYDTARLAMDTSRDYWQQLMKGRDRNPDPPEPDEPDFGR